MSTASRSRRPGKAAKAAIDTLRDDVLFAIVAGNQDAHLIYPGTPTMVRASQYSRQAAKTMIDLVRPSGRDLDRSMAAAGRPAAGGRPQTRSRHAILLTDGQDNERADAFAEALAGLRGTRSSATASASATDWVPRRAARGRPCPARHVRLRP